MANDAIANLHVRMIGDTAAYQKSMRAAAVETGRFYAASQTGSKGASRFGVAVQSAGYQVNDFVVQVMAGQSATVAFAQQASQFAGVFGPAGALAGAGIAIASVVAQLVMTSSSAKQAAEDVGILAKALKSLEDKRTASFFSRASDEQALARLSSDISKVTEKLEDLRAREAAALSAVRMGRDQDAVVRLAESAKTITLERIELEKELIDLEDRRFEIQSKTIEAQQKSIMDLKQMVDEIKKTDREVFLKSLDDALTAADKATEEWIKLVESNERLARSYLELADPVEKFKRQLEEVQSLVGAQGGLTQDQADRIKSVLNERELERLKKMVKESEIDKEFGRLWETVSDRAGQAFADMVLTGENALKRLSDIVARSVLEIVARMAIINPLLNSIFNFSGTSILPSFFGRGALPAPTKATGGPVAAGQPYRWNEMGREYFMPDTGGKVVKASDSQAGPIFNISYNFQGGVTPADLARAIPSLVKTTKAAIHDAQQRWQPA